MFRSTFGVESHMESSKSEHYAAYGEKLLAIFRQSGLAEISPWPLELECETLPTEQR